jgi:CcmD family protein
MRKTILLPKLSTAPQKKLIIPRCARPVRAAVSLVVFTTVLVTEASRAWAAPGADWKPYVAEHSDEVSAPLFVVLAYSAIWIVLLLFVLSVWRRQRELEAEIADLRQQLGGRP